MRVAGVDYTAEVLVSEACGRNVILFNDKPGRTKNDVIAALRVAIRKIDKR